MTEKLDKYILDIQIDNETGEEHCTILKTDRTTNMDNWITIISAIYTHHSVFEPLIKELNKLSKENEQLKQKVSFYKYFQKDARELEKENEQLKQQLKTKYIVNKQYEELQRLKEENEQLKGEVAHYKLILMSLEEEAKRISSIRSCKND